MTAFGRNRIALRIYVVTIAAVFASVAALLLLAVLGRERQHLPGEDVFRDLAQYAAATVGSRWPDPSAIQDELRRIADSLPVDIAVYRWDGSAVASTAATLAPLAESERDLLRHGRIIDRPPGFLMPPRVAAPFTQGGTQVGYLVLASRPPEPRPPFLPNELALVALSLVAIAIAAVVLGRSIARPLDVIAQTASRLGAGDLAARTGLSRTDEVGSVARAFDDMADRVVRLLRGQTELVANVAHELRTPLARIRVALDLAAEGDLVTARESLAEINEDLGELEALVSDILISARMDLQAGSAPESTPPLHRAPLDLSAVVEQAAERIRHRYPGRVVRVVVDLDLPTVSADSVLLRRALDNLLDNARKYSSPPSEIVIRARPRGPDAVIEVTDAGEGIEPEDLERIFTPFFRTDRSRARATGGVGLGLALSRRIVEAHGGTLAARSVPDEGTTMTITLPGGG